MYIEEPLPKLSSDKCDKMNISYCWGNPCHDEHITESLQFTLHEGHRGEATSRSSRRSFKERVPSILRESRRRMNQRDWGMRLIGVHEWEDVCERQSPSSEAALREDTWSVARCWCSWVRCRCRERRHACLGSVQCRAGTPAPLLQQRDRETLVRCCSAQNRHSSTALTRHLPELSLHWLSALRDSVVATSLARNPFVKTLLCSHCVLSRSNCREICKSKTQNS